MTETYETHAKGIRILPGQWRPHYPFEQIAWISPPWPSQDYIWLDFPEAIFSDIGLLFLSHVDPKHPVLFPDLPKVPWQPVDDGLCFERTLPNQMKFGGTIQPSDPSTISLELYIYNDSKGPLKDIKLQTCAYLRGIKEFSDYTQDNKFIHVQNHGWISLHSARAISPESGSFHLGWRGGPKVADLPVIVTKSAAEECLVAFTWYDDTYSLIGNPNHPCMQTLYFLTWNQANVKRYMEQFCSSKELLISLKIGSKRNIKKLGKV